MDAMTTGVTQYSEADFLQVLRSLLPKGKYWQAMDNQELTQVLEALAAEFKRVHDDVQLALLTENKNELFGWKLSDYHRLLVELGVDGEVTDRIETPNIIYVSLGANERSEQALDEVEAVRLPHTLIYWSFCTQAELIANVATARHVRNYHRHEVNL